MSTHQPSRVLIVDDEASQMRALCDTLKDHGYDTTGFTDGQAAIEALQARPFDILLADLAMPGMNGIELLQKARQVDPDLVGIIMTGEGTITTAVEAMKSGALDYILKPFKLSFILPVLERALAVRRLRATNAALERSVRQRTIELETANRELDAFVRSATHDLRSPLTVVMMCAEQLMDDYGSMLPGEARRELEKVIGGTERMKRLIDDLLRLSGIGRRPLDVQPTRVSALVNDVVGELRASNSGRDVEVRLAELPDCMGDPGLLKQVFINLLSNAFKFTRDVPSPTIEVSCREMEGEKIYSVRDNGVGFDMAHAEKLFVAFQRLHSTAQFEGTGVGLSIVQRVVERHGGRVWADATVGKGATFHFCLPR